MNLYIVKTSAARMPYGCWGRYAYVAVIKMMDGPRLPPKMISERARGVKRVAARWGPVNVGKTERCAYQRALVEAQELAEALNRDVS